MNTKGIKFLAVLAVLAMAFAVFAVVADSEESVADTELILIDMEDFDKGKLVLEGDSYIEAPLDLVAGNYTVDLAGYTLYDQGDGTVFNMAESETSLKIIANGGSIEGSNYIVSNTAASNSVEVIGGTYNTSGVAFYTAYESEQTKASGSFKIANATIIGANTGIEFEGSKTATIVVDNVTISNVGEGIVLDTIGTAKLNNVKVISIGPSVQISSGTVTISGGSYTALDSGFAIVIDDDCAEVPAAGDVSVLFQNDVKLKGYGCPVKVEAFDEVEQKITVSGLDATSLDITGTAANVKIAPSGSTLEIISEIPETPIQKNSYLIIPEGTASIDGLVVKEGVSVTINAKSEVSGVIKLDTAENGQIVTLADFYGVATFTKGSIIMQSGYSYGDIILQDGDVLKLSGYVDGLHVYTADDARSATVLIEEGTTLEGYLYIESSAITMNIYGKVSGELETDDVKEVNVYDGSDINQMYVNDYTNVKGFGASGTWTYDDGELILNDFKGTYNFGQMHPESVIVKGDVVISYAPVDYVPMGFINAYEIRTLQDSGTLTLNIDLSNYEFPEGMMMAPVLEPGMPPMSMPIMGIMVTKIDTVGINVDISGTPAWTEEQLKGLMATGLMVNDGSLYNAPLSINVLFDEGIGMGQGAMVMGDMTNCGKVDVKGSMSGIMVMGDLKDTQITGESAFMGVMFGGELSSNSTITSASSVFIMGETDVLQDSSITANDMVIQGPIDNNGTIKITGNSIIYPGAGIYNYAKFENSGKMAAFGFIENYAGQIEGTAGSIINSGEILYHSYWFPEGANFEMDIDEDIPEAADKARLSWVDISMPSLFEILMDENFQFNMDGFLGILDGKYPVKGAIGLYIADSLATDGYYYEGEDFEGTLTIGYTGYTLEITDGTVSVAVTFEWNTDAVDEEEYLPTIGNEYEITVSGTATLKNEDETKAAKTVTLENNTEGTQITYDDFVYGEESQPTYSRFVVEAGTVKNTGRIAVEAYDTVYIDEDASFVGDLELYWTSLYIYGDFEGNIFSTSWVDICNNFNGDVTAYGGIDIYHDEEVEEGTTFVVNGNMTGGSVYIDEDVELNGDITAKYNVGIRGKAVGDIECECKYSYGPGSVYVKDFTGTVTITGGNSYFAAAGNVEASVIYTSGFISTEATADAEAIITPFTVTYDVKTVTIENEDDEQSNDGPVIAALVIYMAPGIDAADGEEGAPGWIEYATEIDDGELSLDILPFDGTASVTVKSGTIMFNENYALAKGYELVIEADATLQVDIAADLDVTHAALKVSKDATRNYEVNVIGAPEEFGEVIYVMSFDISAGYTIYSDIAYAVTNCDPNSELIVGLDGAHVESDISVKEGVQIIVGDEIELIFDDINAVMADGAAFVLEGSGKITFSDMILGDNTISGTFTYDGNTIVLDGVAFEAIDNECYITGVAPFLDEDVPMIEVVAVYVGTMTVAEGIATGELYLDAVVAEDKVSGDSECFFATLVIAEGAEVVDAEIVDSYYEEDEDVEAFASIVEVNGTLNTNDLEITGIYCGTGQVVILDGGEVFIGGTALVDVRFVDETGNGFAFVAVEESDIYIAVTEIVDGQFVAVITAEVFSKGQIDAIGDAYLNGVYIDVDAIFVADKAIIIGGEQMYSEAQGKLKAKELDTENGVLIYDATYAEGEYTVYTHFLNIDQTEVTDITVDGDALTENLIDYPADALTVAGINLTIAEDTVLTIYKPMIIGTPRTSLGAGTVITGTIIISDDVYIIAYNDADVSAAEILGTDEKAAAKSAFDIDGTAYADVYANSDLTLDVPAGEMKPEIKGYVFTFWTTYSGAALDEAAVGTTDVTSTLVAGKVTITLKDVPGVAYYINNVEQATEIAIKVDVESIITMKITDTSVYEGTPKINGQVSYKVTGDDDGTVLEATGVTEKKAPSNDDDDDDGLGLTEILLIVLVVLIAVMCVILILRLNRS